MNFPPRIFLTEFVHSRLVVKGFLCTGKGDYITSGEAQNGSVELPEGWTGTKEPEDASSGGEGQVEEKQQEPAHPLMEPPPAELVWDDYDIVIHLKYYSTDTKHLFVLHSYGIETESGEHLRTFVMVRHGDLDSSACTIDVRRAISVDNVRKVLQVWDARSLSHVVDRMIDYFKGESKLAADSNLPGPSKTWHQEEEEDPRGPHPGPAPQPSPPSPPDPTFPEPYPKWPDPNQPFDSHKKNQKKREPERRK